MNDWPVVSIIIGGDGSTPAARHTAASVESSDYPGVVQIVTGHVDEGGSPAEIANGHAGEANGSYLMMLVPGVTLDPRCLRYAVERAEADPSNVAVALQWRAHDGSVVEAGSHLAAADEITPLFRGGALPNWLLRGPYRTHVSSIGSLLIRAQQFFVAGGFNLELDGSPYQAAHLALSLTAGGGHIEVETRAVAFVPPHPPEPVSGTELALGRNRLQADFADSLNQLHFQSSIDSDLSVLLNRQDGSRVLWTATHIPDSSRSGVDARHLERIGALMSQGRQVVVWATHTDGTDSKELEAMGVRWVAQPQSGRWDLRPPTQEHPWLQELIRQLHWDTVVISDRSLGTRITQMVRKLSPDTAVVLDLGTVRFSTAHEDGDRDGASAVPDILEVGAAEGVVVATAPDADVLRRLNPEVPVTAFVALGTGEVGRPPPDGSLLFIGNLLHRPNTQAIEWWIDEIASRVEAQMGRSLSMRIVGNGAAAYRSVWNHPTRIEVGGWQPSLSEELGAARLLVVPLPYATGTGGRIATALSHGLPVVVSTPAAAMLAPSLTDLVRVGTTADELAGHIAELMGDDSAWEAAVERLAEVDFGALRQAQTEKFGSWLEALPTAPRKAALAR